MAKPNFSLNNNLADTNIRLRHINRDIGFRDGFAIGYEEGYKSCQLEAQRQIGLHPKESLASFETLLTEYRKTYD